MRNGKVGIAAGKIASSSGVGGAPVLQLLKGKKERAGGSHMGTLGMVVGEPSQTS